MKPRCFVSAAALIGLTLTVQAASARAETGEWLAYRAPEGCPTEAQFIAAVRARGARIERDARKDNGRKMDVSIQRDEGGFSGSFQVREADAVSGARELRATRCVEVTNGLAVVTAIALAQDKEGVAAASPSSVGSPSGAVPATAPSLPVPAEPKHDFRKSGDVFTKDIEVNAGTLRFESLAPFTVSAGGTVGLVPSLLLPRYDVGIFRANFATLPNALTYLVGPILRARVSWLGDATYRSSDSSTTARGWSFGMSGCRAPAYDTRGLVVLGCIEYSAGIMLLDTKNAAGTSTQSKTMGMAMLGIGIESEYNLGAHFHLDLKIGGELSLNKLTAERPDGSQIFHSQPFSAHALLGVGVHF
jgi:hypothetical protein